jgi:hypothetical protein
MHSNGLSRSVARVQIVRPTGSTALVNGCDGPSNRGLAGCARRVGATKRIPSTESLAVGLGFA